MTSKTDDKLIGFLKNRIEVENMIVESVNTHLDELKNIAVRGVLRGIAMDSAKHAELYFSAILLLSTTPTALNQENLDTQRKIIEKHITIESELIVELEKEIPKISDNKVLLLLNAILADERRHHELLKMVLETVVKGETITEEDWWKMLWEGVPFHGTPGGG